jgi:hypothetical protein
MAKTIGRLVQIALAKETTRGTTPASPTYWIPYADGSQIEENFDNAVNDQVYGIIESNIGQTRVKNWSESTLTGHVTDTIFPLLLLSLFGTDTVTTHSGESVIYDHTFSVQQGAQHQSLSMYRHDPASNVDRSYANCVVTKMDIEYVVGKFITYSASLMGQQGVVQSSYTPATTSENRFVPQYFTFKTAPDLAGVNGTMTATGTAASTVNVTALSINTSRIRVGMGVTGTNVPAGATVAAIVSATAFTLSAATTGAMGTITFSPLTLPVISAKLSVDAGSDAYQPMGTITPSDFFNKEFSVSGELELLWQNETDMKTRILSNAGDAVILDLINTDVTLGVASNPEVKATLAKVYYTSIGQPVKIKDMLTQVVKFTAAYSPSDAQMIKMLVTNAVASY